MNLSIIIPAFNEADYLPSTLDSIQRASERLRDRVDVEVEVIVVDNNSTDDTAAIAEAMGATVIGEPGEGAKSRGECCSGRCAGVRGCGCHRAYHAPRSRARGMEGGVDGLVQAPSEVAHGDREESPGVGGVHLPLDDIPDSDGHVLCEEPEALAVGSGGIDPLDDAGPGVDEHLDDGAVDEHVDV